MEPLNVDCRDIFAASHRAAVERRYRDDLRAEPDDVKLAELGIDTAEDYRRIMALLRDKIVGMMRGDTARAAVPALGSDVIEVPIDSIDKLKYGDDDDETDLCVLIARFKAAARHMHLAIHLNPATDDRGLTNNVHDLCKLPGELSITTEGEVLFCADYIEDLYERR